MSTSIPSNPVCPSRTCAPASFLGLEHVSGARCFLDASKANHASGKELWIYGSRGSYRATPSDVPFDAIVAGRRPKNEGDDWGYDAEERCGVLSTDAWDERIPSLAARYQDYYTQFAAACRGEAVLPVSGEQGLRTVAVLDAARRGHEAVRTEMVE